MLNMITANTTYKALLWTLILIILNFIYNPFCIAKELYTPSVEYFDNNEPKDFPSSNNLIIDQLPEISDKDKIIIYGQVLDIDGIPISGAKIFLWQVDINGKYVYEPLKAKANKKLFSKKTNPTFKGAGSTISNNEGEFLFISMFPSRLGHANIHVMHDEFGELQTRLYLTEKNIYTGIDKTYKQEYKFFIVMSGKNRYKRY